MMPAANNPATPKQMVKMIQVLFYTVTAGLILISLVFGMLGYFLEPAIPDKTAGKSLLIAIFIAAAVFLTLAEKYYRKRILAAQPAGISLTDKLNQYRAALTIYLAISEGMAFFAAIFYLLTNNKLFFIVTVVILIGILLKQPKKSRIFNELQLNTAEQLELN
jgi:hypothetical protein